MNSNVRGKTAPASAEREKGLFGKELSFASREAYKLLRTNLLFSLPEKQEGRAHVIGMTSSLKGEGKSTTTINLAATLAEQGERVLIVEGDLRLPSLHKKMRVSQKPGLSNCLVSKADPFSLIQTVRAGRMNDTLITFDVLTAGDIPPNPSELIGSDKMKRRIEELASQYQFILLDLPPITAVTDALVATKIVDGLIMVVRNEHADTGSLKEAMRQLKLVDAKVLGFVYTCANGSTGGYRQKYKYRNYKYRYYDDVEKK